MPLPHFPTLVFFPVHTLPLTAQRIDIPDLSVNILAAMFMEANSWKSSFAAYGIWICETLVLFLQGRHSKLCVESFLI
jgi:hypothetical protein